MAWTKLLDGPVAVDYCTGKRHLEGSRVVNDTATAEGELVADMEAAARLDERAYAVRDAYGKTYPATPAQAALAMARKLAGGL